MQKLQTVNAETLLYEPLEKPSFTEAFVPIISEDIRKKIAEGDTFDNEGLSA